MYPFFRLLPAALLVLLANSASAATISAAEAFPAQASISAVSPAVDVKHRFAVKYYNNEKFPCGAAIKYSDGSVDELIVIQSPTSVIQRERQYAKPGIYGLTLTGVAHGGKLACLGSVTSTSTISLQMNLGGGTGTSSPRGRSTPPAKVDQDPPKPDIRIDPNVLPGSAAAGGGSTSRGSINVLASAISSMSLKNAEIAPTQKVEILLRGKGRCDVEYFVESTNDGSVAFAQGATLDFDLFPGVAIAKGMSPPGDGKFPPGQYRVRITGNCNGSTRMAPFVVSAGN